MKDIPGQIDLLLALKRSNAGKVPEESKEESNDSAPETQQEKSDYDEGRGRYGG